MKSGCNTDRVRKPTLPTDRFWAVGVLGSLAVGVLAGVCAWRYGWEVDILQLFFGAALAICAGFIVGYSMAALLVAKTAVDKKNAAAPDTEPPSKSAAQGGQRSSTRKEAEQLPEQLRPDESVALLNDVGTERARLAAVEQIRTIRDLANASEDAIAALRRHWRSDGRVDDAIFSAKRCVRAWDENGSQSRVGT